MISPQELERAIKYKRVKRTARQVNIKRDHPAFGKDTDYYFTVVEAAESIQITAQTFNRWYDEGNIDKFLNKDPSILSINRKKPYGKRKKYKKLFSKLDEQREENNQHFKENRNQRLLNKYNLNQWIKKELNEEQAYLYQMINKNEINGSARMVEAWDMQDNYHKFWQVEDFKEKFNITYSQWRKHKDSQLGFMVNGVKKFIVHEPYADRTDFYPVFNKNKKAEYGVKGYDIPKQSTSVFPHLN